MQKEKEDFIKEFLKEPKKTGMLAQVVAAEMALISHDTGCCNDGYYLFPKIRKGRAKFNILHFHCKTVARLDPGYSAKR